MKPLISFVIPTLNEEKGLEHTLQSLSSYSGPKEIIITDGNSTDKTIEIAKKYTDKITIHTGAERQTIAGGRNAGAAIATGEFFISMDADSYIKDIDAFFEKALKLFADDPKLVGLTVSYNVFPEVATLMDRIVFKMVAFNFMISNNILHIGGSGGEFQMVRASAFKEIGGYNEKLVVAEDNDLFLRLNKIGRTRCEMGMAIFHSGRRAHKLGWPKLLYQWTANYISLLFLKKSVQSEWTQIR